MIADDVHKFMIMAVKDKTFIENVKQMTPKYRTFAEDQLKKINEKEDFRKIEYLKWIVEQSKSNFYLGIRGSEITLIKRNFKGALTIGYNTPRDDLKHFYNGYDYIIELLNIHSFKKGEGYKMMKLLIELSKKAQSPISLYTETEVNVKYFERYGFVNIGRMGINNEYLMILNK
ncbi:hypothetical protein SFC08_04390 [Lysinibacillus halotolerans]